MLGIPDFWIWLPYLLCIVSAIACIAYGLARWNKDGDELITQEDQQWAEEQDKMEEDL